MVNINLNIQKKDLWLLSAIMVFLVGVVFVIAYGSGASPSVMGHSAEEIGFIPASYTGQESVTFPNGLIMKKGRVSLVSDVSKTVTFATPFPNAIENVQFTQTNSVHIHGWSWRVWSRSVNNIVLHSDADSGMYDWVAWGY